MLRDLIVPMIDARVTAQSSALMRNSGLVPGRNSKSPGGNLFNHAATGYLDATGAFHVLVVGGDDVNTPTKKHKGVFYY